MKQLRNLEVEPVLYSVGDRVLIEERTRGSFHQKVWTKVRHVGTIKSVGVSGYNSAYDWYVVELEDGRIIESWWMTSWHILSKLESPAQNGLPSQEA